jgi:hypothetical protein
MSRIEKIESINPATFTDAFANPEEDTDAATNANIH